MYELTIYFTHAKIIKRVSNAVSPVDAVNWYKLNGFEVKSYSYTKVS